jgi:DegV family protein with EDD domain
MKHFGYARIASRHPLPKEERVMENAPTQPLIMPSFSRPIAQVRVVTDSAADVQPDYAESIGLIIVPNQVRFGPRSYYDGVTIRPEEFYRKLEQAPELPATEPVTTNALFDAYQLAFMGGATDILSIHVSGKLSQSCARAEMMKQAFPVASIQVIDSLQASVGMWPVVTLAAQAAKLRASLQDLIDLTQSILARTQFYLVVDSLEHLHRAGRIGRAQSLIGQLLDTRPILTIKDGVITPIATVRTRQAALERLREIVLGYNAIETLVVAGSSKTRITEMIALLQPPIQQTIQTTWLGPTVGANTGPAVAIGVVTR